MSRSNAGIILEALLMGIPCKIGEHTYGLDTQNRVCQKAFDEFGNEIDEWLPTYGGGTIAGLIELAEKSTREEIGIIGGNITLNHINKGVKS